MSSSQQTPRPAATPEFGFVEPGGSAHAYPRESPDALTVLKRSVGPFDNNVYLLRSGREALIVDGANQADLIMEMADGCKVVGIVQTHGHPDHVLALPELVAALNCPVYAHEDDAMPVEATPLHDGATLRVGQVDVSVMHTPGHTPGSLCFQVGSFLFSGDTLFPGGPGNTDGDATRFSMVMDSLERRLFALPDDTRVCPGHGLDTFIGLERAHLGVWRARGW